MYIIYNIYNVYNIYNIYNIYNLFISLVWRFKNSSPTDPPHVCYDLIVSC